MFSTPIRRYCAIFFLVFLAVLISLPESLTIPISKLGMGNDVELMRPYLKFNVFGKQVFRTFDLRQGLDIQGGTQIVLRADMSSIPEEQKQEALDSAKEVILRRVDLYGVSEPVVQTARSANDYRIVVELAGVDDPADALELIGRTAQLDFRLQADTSPVATSSVMAFMDSFEPVDITGADLKRSTVQFDQQTKQPVVELEFNAEGTKKFAEVTKNHTNEVLGIFLDGYPMMLPVINSAILDGRAIITGQFSVEEAKSLSIQLNAGALPVPIEVLEQRTIGASLGQSSVQQSVRAGIIGLGLVMIFMVLLYGWKGVIADLALIMYALFTIAIYKLFNITLTLPGIAGMLLSIGMAVDANILIFERMKEELRLGKPFETALNLGFGRAWDSIKDANFATIFTAIILINPLNLSFLNSSGIVRGFGLTLLIGVLISLFTGVVVSRTLMRIFLKPYKLTHV